jgi:hypothetical protein
MGSRYATPTTFSVPRKVNKPTRTAVTVPQTVVDLLELDPARRAAADSALTQLGAALEFDIAVLDAVLPGLGSRAVDFFRAARELWSNPAVSQPSVTVRVPLIDVRQIDSRAQRKDLTEQLAALERLAALRPALALLDSSPDWDALAQMGVLDRSSDRSSIRLTLSAPIWPLELGGTPSPGELHREVVLEASHAAWRDRRARRLLRVTVSAYELWPDPSDFTGEAT